MPHKNKSLKELLELQEEIQILIDMKREEEKGNFLKRVDDLARESGLSNDEVTALFDKTNRKGVLPPKYRNPEDPSQTWSGHGRKPKWFKEFMDQGRKKSEFLI